MKPLSLSEQQRDNLLEMCKALFPKYREIYWNSGKGDNGSSEHIGFGKPSKTHKHWTDYEYIHWFEFCVHHLSKRIFTVNGKVMSGYLNFLHNANYTKLHPVDYLYKEFKKLQ